MDAMALLCNLQADGPATLRRLRSLGCRTLEDLGRMPMFELATALNGDVAFAQRFVREGHVLQQRFGPEPLELEEAQVPAPGRREERAVRSPLPPEARPPAIRPARPTAPPALEVRDARRSETPSTRVFKNAPLLPAGTQLRPGVIEGLDASWCQALIGQGILTLETLIDAPGLPLARSLSRSYTRLLDLQCLARRHLNESKRGVRIVGAEAAVPTSAPARRPLAEPDYTIFPPPPRAHALPVEAPVPSPRVEESRPAVTHDLAATQDIGVGGPFI